MVSEDEDEQKNKTNTLEKKPKTILIYTAKLSLTCFANTAELCVNILASEVVGEREN